MRNETKHVIAVSLAKRVVRDIMQDIDYLRIVETVGSELEGLDVDTTSEISDRVERLIKLVDKDVYIRDYAIDENTGKLHEDYAGEFDADNE